MLIIKFINTQYVPYLESYKKEDLECKKKTHLPVKKMGFGRVNT